MPVTSRKMQIRWMYLLGCSLLFSMALTACSSNVPKTETSKTDNTLTNVGTQTNDIPASPNIKNPDTDKTLRPTKSHTERLNLRPGEEEWTTIYPGEEAHGLKFTKDGALLYQGKVLLSKIPVSYVSDGTVKYAGRLIISNPSPSGKFNFFKGCEQSTDGSGSLCWVFYVVDKEKGKVKETQPGKYGPLQWV